MLHVDGMKGAGQGPTGSEAGPAPAPPRAPQGGWAPGALTGAWRLGGGPRPLRRPARLPARTRGTSAGGTGDGWLSGLPASWPPRAGSTLSFPSCQGRRRPPAASCSPALPASGCGSGLPLRKHRGAEAGQRAHTDPSRLSRPGPCTPTVRRKGAGSYHRSPREAGIDLAHHRVPVSDAVGTP